MEGAPPARRSTATGATASVGASIAIKRLFMAFSLTGCGAMKAVVL